LPGIDVFLEALKKIRYRDPEPKICPKCRGHNIYPEQNFGILPVTYRCRDCGYEGTLVLELEEEETEK